MAFALLRNGGVRQAGHLPEVFAQKRFPAVDSRSAVADLNQ